MAEMALGSWLLVLGSWLLALMMLSDSKAIRARAEIALGSWFLALVAPRSDRIFGAGSRMDRTLFLKGVSPFAVAASNQGLWISQMIHRHGLRPQLKMNRY